MINSRITWLLTVICEIWQLYTKACWKMDLMLIERVFFYFFWKIWRFVCSKTLFIRKTFVIAEVVLTYLNAENSTKVIDWVAKTFKKCLFAEFEQFNPTSTFGQIMTSSFRKLQSPFLGMEELKKRFSKKFSF